MYKYKILTIPQVIDAEKSFIEKNSESKLFNLATKKIKHFIESKFKKKKILFICGPGKNGLDGLKTSSLLRLNVIEVYKTHDNDDKEFKLLKKCISRCDIIFDCIFGIGINRKLNKKYVQIINIINKSTKYVVSIDLPSGFDGDTGLHYESFIIANQSIAMGFFKPCHFLLPSKKYVGKVTLIDLDLKLPEKLNPEINLINRAHIKSLPLKYDCDVNKYDKGHVIIIGGKMSGASRIVAYASRKIGAGLSTISVSKENLIYYNNAEPGTIIEMFDISTINEKDVLVIGPGLGKNFNRKKILKILKLFDGPIVLDADAISIFQSNRNEFYSVLKRKNIVITPHFGEFCRTFDYDYKKSKIENCLHASSIINNPVVLKGNDTTVGFSDGKVFVDKNSKNVLATAGTGDMLCGMISGLLAQGISMKESIIASIYFQSKISNIKNKNTVEDFIELISYDL